MSMNDDEGMINKKFFGLNLTCSRNDSRIPLKFKVR